MNAMKQDRRNAKVSQADPGPQDEELIRAVKAGDAAAFQDLVERYTGRIFTLVASMMRNRAEAEDVVQEVFFKVYRKIDRFEGKSSFYTWLYRVALNTATDHLKKKRIKLVSAADEHGLLEIKDDGPKPDASSRVRELRTQMADAIAELPEKYRDILVLREYEDCSYEEISQILGISKGTVESRLFRARGRLRDKVAPFLNC